MPALQNPTRSTILVTGSNGFLATWIVNNLLKAGYNVRASVRSMDRGKHLTQLFKGGFGDKLEIFPTGDMAQAGAFDEAVKGVDAIIHTAAEVNLNAVEPKDIIGPAIGGYLNLMTSALKYGDRLKRIVITSSCAAVTSYSDRPITINEKNWNDASVKDCEEKGRDASGLAKYSASKTFAEKAGWDFYEKHKSEISWDLTILNPPWIFGPVLHEVPSIDKLNSSSLFWYNAITKGKALGDASPRVSPSDGWVDVRDAALAHIRSLEVEEAGGERIILCAGPFVFQDAIDAVNSLQSSPWPSHKEPFAKGDAGEKEYKITWDNAKEKRILGVKFRTHEEMTRDVLADWENKGWN
ncbi:D-lactaldehyde dehydrogenase [Dendrothele bispora CBS 962.96]|uniref:D-lactaldehyde dehydrogenase n=1 Tax=Dendrothele bispora (strain CBS 962.96) TaxID=1314807 RepID=A0A4S8LVG1_DENBC|nr:D-lactaldehyde dehydrogenase [Dendrothele bispora CBS 962.96]